MRLRRYKIGEVCQLVRGTSPTLKTPFGPYPLVVTAEFRRSADSWQIEGPAVCVPLISSTGHGDAALHRVHYQEGRFALANLLVALLPNNSDVCDAKYLYHLLMARKDQIFVPLMLGTANVSLKERDIAEVEIPLPPLAEQRRIVARIEELAAQIHEGLSLRKLAVDEVSALPHSFLSSLLRTEESLRRWPFLEIATIAEINPSRGKKVPSPNMEISFIPMRAVDDTNGVIGAPEVRAYGEVKTGYTCFLDGDVIFARITPCMQNGKSAIANNLLNGIGFGSTEFHVIRPGPEIDARWIHHLIRHREFIDDAAKHFTGTAGQQRVPASFLRAKKILVPPLTEQYRIIAELDALQSEVDTLKRHQRDTAAELDALLPAILDRAFRGEL